MRYGLIGEHLTHSFSKTIHEMIKDQVYELREVQPRDLESFMKEADFQGINVTIPYKEAVIPYLDEIDPRAERIGAVNTIVRKNSRLIGFNTDYDGMKSLIEKTGITFSGRKVLILGTGGTSRTAGVVARDLGASDILKVSRTGKDGALTYEEAARDHRDADIIINTTPCGMFPGSGECPIDLDSFPNCRGVIDAIYNPLRSTLVLQAQDRGIPARGGLYMLVSQAVYAAQHFYGETYEKELIDRIFRAVLDTKRNLCLIGMSQSGKTTVGRLLAQKLDKEFVDTDQLIISREGMEITDLFARKGEAYFRDVESRVIRELSVRNDLVIATGGGVPLRDSNVFSLKQNGILLFLDRPLDHLTPTGDRPLADSEDKIYNLFRFRYPIYRSACDQRVVNAGSAQEAADKIIRILNGKKRILVINGPNLNMLGIREPDIYGYMTYRQLCKRIKEHADKLDTEVSFYQSNHEGALVDRIQEAYGQEDGIVINPGAYTHTSVAILDALKAVAIPAVEVHISKVDAREDFRQISYIRQACQAVISGRGTDGYLDAVDLLVQKVQADNRVSKPLPVLPAAQDI